MQFEERALAFRCQDDWLYGVATVPQGGCSRGVLIVVGGPQYRGGSHRQFTLLARALGAEGIAAMRFDYRGMGDSQGTARDFEMVADDLRAAIDQFMQAVPGMREVVLWGLCDGASAALMYAARDPRVCGLVLLNPWVRTEGSLARTTLKHYYRDRLLDAGFWRQLVRGKLDFGRSLRSLYALMRTAVGSPAPSGDDERAPDSGDLPDRMHAGMRQFDGQVLLILSGADLTAREFFDMASSTPKWKRLLESPRLSQHWLDKADHTFSRRAWRDQVAHWTGEWMRSW